MGAKKKAVAAGGGAVGAVRAAKDNPYVQRLVEDDDLRENIQQAFESARSAVSRLSNGKSPTKSIFDDKKFQKDIREAADAFRDASVALHEAPSKRKSSGGGGVFRKLLLVGVAAGLALALSEGLRKKVLDALFGAEEEFEYTSTTTSTGAGATGATTTTSTSTTGATTTSG
jgi:hypothetical protein